ncbi:recombinase family protein [Streptomyces sp. NBC_01320]|uniref:recombinase family protein n=1 Tax=Streptomyces sp. NBC_01320 TaxID=2903824 RepID=UPI002E125C33|nr:recombinase family protein [Streptomyces sp. NBC_01320]
MAPDTADQLRRGAYLYVRQSSLKQVVNNTESTQRQYALRGRAIALGWGEGQITVIDTDQGQSGASAAGRDGFQLLVSEVSLGRAGIVLGLEVSRLARNNTDWHRLLEICAMTGTLILDEDGLYDPRSFNDRLVLGLKGTMSEAELHLLKARLRGGQLSKARRGELKQCLPIGYVHDPLDRIVKDPDAAVRGAVERVFTLFAASGSARQVVIAFAADQLSFPARIRTGAHKGELVWGPLKHWRVLNMLHNPCYAGAFVYGRKRSGRTPEGKTTLSDVPREQWTALIEDHHEGYLSFEQWEDNGRLLLSNATGRGEGSKAGPPREGPALLQGLVICGKCGRRMTVGYRLHRGELLPDYRCMTHAIQDGARICERLPGKALDAAVARLVLGALTPLAIDAALKVTDQLTARAAEADQLRASHVKRAQHHADLARRRYLAVDPDNRLVADALEADWNRALREVTEAKDTYERAKSEAAPLEAAVRDRLGTLAADVHRLWADADTPMRERKRIARLLITDVTLTRTDQITAQIRLSAGQHHTLNLPMPLAGGKVWKTPAATVDLIDQLLEDHTHREIAAILNARGHASGKGQPFTALLVRNIRDVYHLTHRYDRLRARGLLSFTEYADAIGVSETTVKIWRRTGLIHGIAYNDKNCYLFHPPGPDHPAPEVAQGIRLSDRIAAQQAALSAESRRSAV